MVLGKRRARPSGHVRSGKRARRTTVPRNLSIVKSNVARADTNNRLGFPAKRSVTLRYCDYQDFSGTTMGQVTYSLNNITDPYVTGVGHQPLGHDEWAKFYSNYIVTGCRAKVTAQRGVADNLEPVVFMLQITDTPNTVTSLAWRVIAEQAHTVTKMITADWDNAMSCQNLYVNWDAKKWFNVKDLEDNVERFGGISDSNPADQAYLNILIDPLDGSADYNIRCMIMLEYDVTYSTPNLVPTS